MEYTALCISQALSVRGAMKALDETARGIVFIVEDRKLLAVLTDGDVRRYLLRGGKLEDPVLCAANRSPRTARDLNHAKTLYHERSFVAIPVVDGENNITEIYIGEESLGKRLPSLHVPVVINAGGKGTRLDPYTRILPKPLIPVGELPIIEHIMQRFQTYDCDAFHIIVNYKKQLIKAFFSENDHPYNVTWYEEGKPLGTGGGLSLLRGHMRETFFFTNCDILLQSNYDSMLRFHRERHNAITMICAYKHLAIPYGVIDIGENGDIRQIREKPEMSFLTNTGMYIVEPEVLDDIADDEPVGFPDIVQAQREKGRNVAVYPVSENEWLDMGQMPELEDMRRKLCGE